MGAHAWWYFVAYDADVERALGALRDAEFAAGRYYPVVRFPAFPVDVNAPRPGAKHKSIAAARKAADAAGTRSILDMERVALACGYGVVCPVALATIRRLYGTERPNRGQIEANMDFLESVERGQGVFLV